MSEKSGKSINTKFVVAVLGATLSIVLLWMLMRNLDWAVFFTEVKKANPLHLFMMLIIFYISFLARAVRWKYLLPSGKDYSLKKLFDATMIGFFASIVLPLRAGEFIRPWALCKWQGVPGLTAFASIVVERVFDVIALMLILGLCMSSIQASEDLELVVLGAKALGLIAGCIVFVMLVAYLKPQLILDVLSKILSVTIEKKLPALSEKILSIAKDFIQGFRSISNFKELALVIIWSLVIWVSVSMFYQVGLYAMGESPSLLVGFTVSAFIALAVAAPSAPGFVGTFQYGCVFALHNVFGYSKEQALAYAIIVHLFQMIIILLNGIYILNREGLNLSELKNSKEIPC